jgi:hypothetical protein
MLEVKSTDKRQFQMTLLKPIVSSGSQKLPTDDLFDWLGERAAPAQLNKGIYATIMTEPDLFFADNNEIIGSHRL